MAGMSNGEPTPPHPEPTPQDPAAPPPQPPPDSPGTAGAEPMETTSDERSMAMLAHLLGILTWIFGALIIWLIRKDTSAFVDDQGKEALNFQITLTIAWLVAGVLTCVVIGFVLMAVIWVVEIIFCIIAAVAANRGERYRYPFNIRIIT